MGSIAPSAPTMVELKSWRLPIGGFGTAMIILLI
jgi:hypothetical protein